MNRRTLVTSIATVLGAGAVTYGLRGYLQRQDARVCKACQRPVHDHMRTVAKVAGKTGVYCCPACALSEQRQNKPDVDVLTVTEMVTGQEIPAKDAHLVVGSDVNMCQRAHHSVVGDHQPMTATFDRCSPSILAFNDASSAREFQRQHGGEIWTLASLARRFQK